MTDEKKKGGILSRWLLIKYAFADLGGGMTDFPIAIFLIPFYTEVIGLGPALVGWIALAAGIYDIFTDPLMGTISDRTRTRFGRRRIYFLVGAVPLGLSFWWLFSPISGMEAVSFLIAYLVFYTCMDVVFIPHFSMSAELTPDYDDRTRVQGYNRSFWIIGLLLGVIIPLVLMELVSEGRSYYSLVGLILGGIMTASVLVTFFGTKEKPEYWRDQKVSLKEGIKAIFSNKNYLLLAAANLLYSAGCSIPNTLLIYYAIHWLGVEEDKVLAAVPIYLVASMISVPIWVKISKKLEKKPTYILAFLVAAAGAFLTLLIQPGQFYFLYAVFVVAGIGYGGLMAVPGSMVADVIDFDEYNTGERREGTFFGVWEFFRKASNNTSIWLVLQLLALAGFVQQQEIQAPGVDNVIRLMFGGLAGLVYLTGAVVMLCYTYDRKSVDEIQKKLREKGLPL